MKKSILIVSFVLVSILNVFSQESYDLNHFKDNRIDSVINSVTPSYNDHSNLKKQLLNVLYNKKYNQILDAINTKGFKGFYYLNKYNGQNLNSSNTPDSVFINILKTLTNKLPKNKSKVITKFTESTFINDKMSYEEYEFVNDKTKYFIRIVFINSQINGMLLNIQNNQ